MIDDKNKKLGRGLSSLLSVKSFSNEKKDSFLESFGNETKINITKIFPNLGQPRKNFDKIELESLASSIKERGIIQPILVRKDKNKDGYQIIAGERRWRAAQIAGVHEIPVVIKKISDQESVEITLIENIQREDLNPVEEANAYDELAKKYDYSQEKIAKVVGKSRSHVANMLRLLELPKFVLDNLINKKVTIGHVRPLIGKDNAEELLKIILSKKLSARQSEKLASHKKNIKTRSKLEDPNIKDLESELSQKIGLRTSIKFSEKSTEGSITVYYSNLDQLDDIMRRLKQNK